MDELFKTILLKKAVMAARGRRYAGVLYGVCITPITDGQLNISITQKHPEHDTWDEVQSAQVTEYDWNAALETMY